MREMDEIGIALCRMQANLFEESLEYVKTSSPIFMRRFMNSDVARRMDNTGFLFEDECNILVFEEINEEYGESSYGSNKYNKEALHWIGYIYRYWAYVYEVSSKQVYRVIKPSELKELFVSYCTLDPKEAIDRILEAKGVSYALEDITKRAAVELRRIYKEKRNNS